jgi:peptidoglycan/LPS O-acetylase OafA/YrhL
MAPGEDETVNASFTIARNIEKGGTYIPVLDGWRAVSIILVLISHLLPLGPKAWDLNSLATMSGMTIFFVLSGFLVTRALARGMPLSDFKAHRIARILPLAWAGLAVAFFMTTDTSVNYLASFLFLANIPPLHLPSTARHFWSLQVEMQFYGGIAIVVALLGRRALYAAPALCIAFTIIRIWFDRPAGIETWFRMDEILAGSTLALVHEGWFGDWIKVQIARLAPYVIGLMALALLTADVRLSPISYLRPYTTAVMIGATLYSAPSRLTAMLSSKPARYIATISYAIYVVHGIAMASWLGSGSKLVMYAKRPLLVAVTFTIAHISTFYFEKPISKWVRSFRIPYTP